MIIAISWEDEFIIQIKKENIWSALTMTPFSNSQDYLTE